LFLSWPITGSMAARRLKARLICSVTQRFWPEQSFSTRSPGLVHRRRKMAGSVREVEGLAEVQARERQSTAAKS
jgi:hypothetical protein